MGAKRKWELAATTRAKVAAANKGVLKLKEMQDLMERSTPTIERGVAELLGLAHKAEFLAFVSAAEKAEFKGNAKKALDQYQEALYFLKTDNVDDAKQAELIAKLEAKIVELKE